MPKPVVCEGHPVRKPFVSLGSDLIKLFSGEVLVPIAASKSDQLQHDVNLVNYGHLWPTLQLHLEHGVATV